MNCSVADLSKSMLFDLTLWLLKKAEVQDAAVQVASRRPALSVSAYAGGTVKLSSLGRPRARFTEFKLRQQSR